MKSHTATIALLFLCTFSAAYGNSSDDINSLFEGLFSKTKDSGIDATTFVSCLTSQNQDLAVSTLKGAISLGATCNPSQANGIKAQIQTLVNSVSTAERQCLKVNPIVKALSADFDFAGLSADQIASKISTYALSHLITVCTTVKTLNNDLVSGNFEQFGVDAAAILSQVFVATKFAEFFGLNSATDTLTQIISGLATSASLSGLDAASIVACSDETTAATMQSNIQSLIGEAASCNPVNLNDITTKLDGILKSFTGAQKQCLNGNSAAQQLVNGLHIAGLTPDQIKTKAIAYIMSHLITACSDIKGLNNDITNGNWQQFGVDAGKVALKVF